MLRAVRAAPHAAFDAAAAVHGVPLLEERGLTASLLAGTGLGCGTQDARLGAWILAPEALMLAETTPACPAARFAGILGLAAIGAPLYAISAIASHQPTTSASFPGLCCVCWSPPRTPRRSAC